MSTTPLDVLTLAKQLQQQGGGEATLRSAVSRAYYAALLRADEVFPHRSTSAELGGGSSHTKIISRTQAYANGVKPGKLSALSVAKHLPKLKRSRVTADYFLTETVTEKECLDVVTIAEQVLLWCDDIEQKTAQAATLNPVAAPAPNPVAAPNAPPASRPILTRVR